MPHIRHRLIEPLLLKKIKLWPVVSVLGPRQCGKTTLLNSLLFQPNQFSFLSFDKAANRTEAQRSPELFLKQFEKFPVVLDEAAKVPALFDEIKAIIDSKRIPGRFILTGSVNFSKKIGIRESLTGRTSIVRMGPLLLQETLQPNETIQLSEIQRYLEKGGMPGVCFLRDPSERQDYWESWLDTTCERDIKVFSKGRLSGDLARQIVQLTAELEFPNVSEIARTLNQDSRRINTHLEALEELFVIRKLNPHPSGVGKTLYFPFDCGLASYLQASMRRRWQIWWLIQNINQALFSGIRMEPPTYYLTSRGSLIDFISNKQGFLFTDLPSAGRRETMTLRAAKKALPNHKLLLMVATDSEGFQNPDYNSTPWRSVVS